MTRILSSVIWNQSHAAVRMVILVSISVRCDWNDGVIGAFESLDCFVAGEYYASITVFVNVGKLEDA
jgi:hypothetical protein